MERMILIAERKTFMGRIGPMGPMRIILSENSYRHAAYSVIP